MVTVTEKSILIVVIKTTSDSHREISKYKNLPCTKYQYTVYKNLPVNNAH